MLLMRGAGRVEYWYQAVGCWHVTHPHGVEVFYFPSGQVRQWLGVCRALGLGTSLGCSKSSASSMQVLLAHGAGLSCSWLPALAR